MKNDSLQQFNMSSIESNSVLSMHYTLSREYDMLDASINMKIIIIMRRSRGFCPWVNEYESQVDISQLADAKIVNILNIFVYVQWKQVKNNKVNVYIHRFIHI